MDIVKAISITATAEEGGAETCEIKIPAQFALETMTYVNRAGGRLEILANVKDLKSSGKGIIAACNYAEDNVGEYRGAFLATVEGGTLEWK